MSKYAPGLYVGKNVTTSDYLGYIGATGYAYGPHLHLEISPCRLYNQYDSNCSSWNKYVSFMNKLINYLINNIFKNSEFKNPSK